MFLNVRTGGIRKATGEPYVSTYLIDLAKKTVLRMSEITSMDTDAQANLSLHERKFEGIVQLENGKPMIIDLSEDGTLRTNCVQAIEKMESQQVTYPGPILQVYHTRNSTYIYNENDKTITGGIFNNPDLFPEGKGQLVFPPETNDNGGLKLIVDKDLGNNNHVINTNLILSQEKKQDFYTEERPDPYSAQKIERYEE